MFRSQDGKTSIDCQRGDRLAANYIQEVERFGGRSVMMWASHFLRRREKPDAHQGEHDSTALCGRGLVPARQPQHNPLSRFQ